MNKITALRALVLCALALTPITSHAVVDYVSERDEKYTGDIEFTGNVTFSAGAASSAVAIASGTGDVTVTSSDDISITATDDLTLNGGSAGSVINLGTNTHGNVVHIADNNTTADTVTICSALDTCSMAGIAVTVGSTGTTSALTLQSGTGDVTVTSTDDITVTATDDIAINGGTTGSVLNLGTAAFAHVITVGNTTGATSVAVQSGTGGIVLGDSTNGARGYVETDAPNGDTVLTASACGTVQFVGAAGDDFTLPAPAAGCVIEFVVDAAFATTAMTIVTNSSANVIYGAVDVNSTLVPCSAEDTITIVESAELPGDKVKLVSDGTNWFVTGMGVTTGAITCTQAS
jgi:hypothetical protein